MLIEWVRLKNIKSHEDVAVSFAGGVNAICGKTGAGKSTILEAIGYAVFDHLPYSQADFVREGCKSGTVTVGLRSRLDGNLYHVTRTCGCKADWVVFEPEADTRLVQGKEDVTDWLREHLKVGLDGPTAIPLSVLFQEAIGVPQRLCTAPFLQTPTQRKKVFAPLLGMEDYEKASDNLRETENHLKERMQQMEVESAGLASQVERLPGLKQEVRSLKETIRANEVAITVLFAEIEVFSKEKKALETRKRALEELILKVGKLSGEKEMVERQLASRLTELKVAEEAKALVSGNTAAHHVYLAAQKDLEGLEPKKLARDKLKEEFSRLENEHARLQAKRTLMESRLAELKDTAAEVADLKIKIARYLMLEQEARALRPKAERLKSLAERLIAEKMRLEDLEKEIARVKGDVAKLQVLEKELEDTESARNILLQETANLKADQNRLQAEGKDLKASMDRFQTGEAGPCPFCRQDIPHDHFSEVLKEYENELEALRSRYSGMTALIKEKGGLAEAADGKIRELKAQMKRLSGQAQLDALMSQHAKQQETTAKIESEVASLRDVPRELAFFEREMDVIGDHRARYAVYEQAAKEASELQGKFNKNTVAIRANETSIRSVSELLKPFASLDSEIESARFLMKANESGYQLVLANAKSAEARDSLALSVQDLTQKSTQAQKDADAAKTELAGAQEGFNAARLPEIESEISTSTQRHFALKAELETAQKRAIERATEIEALSEKESRLQEIKAGMEKTASTMKRLQFVRASIKAAGPHVVRTLTEVVSHEASAIFADMLGDHTMGLSWGEDYGITVECSGKARDFRQLSGGEQMSASLAVRLALLKEMSGIDCVFFDEPTPHLDADLRESLAEQITRIKGLGQLFVISHDDTFERITEHVVQVSKSAGKTLVNSKGLSAAEAGLIALNGDGHKPVGEAPNR